MGGDSAAKKQPLLFHSEGLVGESCVKERNVLYGETLVVVMLLFALKRGEEHQRQHPNAFQILQHMYCWCPSFWRSFASFNSPLFPLFILFVFLCSLAFLVLLCLKKKNCVPTRVSPFSFFCHFDYTYIYATMHTLSIGRCVPSHLSISPAVVQILLSSPQTNQ